MGDRIFVAFLQRQFEKGMALAQASDLVELLPFGPPPRRHYLVRFHCKGLVRSANGDIVEHDSFEVGIHFPDDYLRIADPARTLAWLAPRNIWHPNVSDRLPVICVGRLAPGTELTDLIFQIFEIITYAKITMREDDALNQAACLWARENQYRFPIDPRPLKRRSLPLTLEPRTAGGEE
jgi:hypothetical protein